jgi:hypothetical protein
LDKYKVSPLKVQTTLIVVLGLSGYLLIPSVMGRGFQPSLNMAIAGICAEVMLMKTLYDLSTSKFGLYENLFVLTFLLQILMLGFVLVLRQELSITLIWASSTLTYILWQALSFYEKKHEKR